MFERSIELFKESICDEGFLTSINFVYEQISRYVIDGLYTKTFYQPHCSPSKYYLINNVAGMGIKMITFSDDFGISKELLRYKTHESASTKILRKLLSKGMNCLDLGSNIGYYATIESKLIGNSGKVYAMEPIPRNFNLLKQNIKVNNLKNVQPFNMAASNYDGQINLYLSNKSNLCSAIKTDTLLNQTITRKATTVDSFLETENIQPENINLLRMDVEGYETKILEGAKNLLEHSKNITLFIEFHTAIIKSQGINLEDTFGLIEDYGFTLYKAVNKRDADSKVVLNNMKSSKDVLRSHLMRGKGGFHLFFTKND